MKKNNTKEYADLLRQLETKRLAKGKLVRWLDERRMERWKRRQDSGGKRGVEGKGKERNGRDGTGRDVERSEEEGTNALLGKEKE